MAPNATPTVPTPFAPAAMVPATEMPWFSTRLIFDTSNTAPSGVTTLTRLLLSKRPAHSG